MIRWDRIRTAAHLARPGQASDKYRRGVLGLRTGSTAYPGAAVLGAEAAWRTGLGMLRYVPPVGDPAPALGLPTPAAAVLAARPETVFADGTAGSARCDAWVVGSGTDPALRSFAEEEAIRRLLAGADPVVVDAGAIGLLLRGSPEAPVTLTPHRGEFLALWRGLDLGERPSGWPASRDELPGEAALHEAAASLATRLGAAVLLKGSTTVIRTPGGFAASCGPATPWLATAGTGDVLAGILGALLAAHAREVREDPELLGPLAASAAVLHDVAARLAAGEGASDDGADDDETGGDGTVRPITALDVAHALPAAVAAVRRG